MSGPFASQRVVLYEGDGAETLPAERRRDLVRALLEAGYDVRVRAERPKGGGIPVLAKFEAGEADAPGNVHLDGLDAAAVIEKIQAHTRAAEPAANGRWLPWFPVIDTDRCTNCFQCMNFCLFGVYNKSVDGQLFVEHPENCKTNCPACSRVCPDVAIMFPKYRHGPINGDAVNEADVEREHMKVDVSALLGGDIYKLLKERSMRFKSRFAAERDDQKALRERLKCFKKSGVDITDEVQAKLDSMQESGET